MGSRSQKRGRRFHLRSTIIEFQKPVTDLEALELVKSAYDEMNVHSRTLFGLAQHRHAPALFKRTNRWGVPYVAVAVVGIWVALDYVYANEEVKEILDRAIPEKPTKQLQTPHRSVRGGYGTLCLIIDITSRTSSGATSGSNLAWLSTNNS
ncbi:hypothetical protein V8E54_014289 [Elaphomyces granulatus]